MRIQHIKAHYYYRCFFVRKTIEHYTERNETVQLGAADR